MKAKRLAKAYDRFRELDLALKELDRELEDDQGAGGAAFRRRRNLVDDWKDACTQVRAAVAESEGGYQEFTFRTRRGRRSVNLQAALEYLDDMNLLEDALQASALSYKVDLSQMEALLGPDFEDFADEAVEEAEPTAIVGGPSPEDLL